VVQRLFDMATKIYAAIPIDHVIDEHTAIPPRMPWIVDYSRFGNMGISLSSCITEKEIIKAWKIGLSLQSNGSPQKQELSDDDNGSAACSIITIETRREGTDMPESKIWILRDHRRRLLHCSDRDTPACLRAGHYGSRKPQNPSLQPGRPSDGRMDSPTVSRIYHGEEPYKYIIHDRDSIYSSDLDSALGF